MVAMLEQWGANGPAVLCNVTLLTVFYLVARVLDARQPVALAFGFLPLVAGVAGLGLTG